MSPGPESAGMMPFPTASWEPLEGRRGLRVHGEIDIGLREEWRDALAGLAEGTGDVHLEMADVTFICARSTSMLVAASRRLPDGLRIVVHHPPTCLRRVLVTLWPDGVPSLALDGDGAGR